jgi:glutathione peroxidase
MSATLLSIPCTTIKGEQKTLADFAGKAVLVVNTASKCGFTPQYKGLEQLWQNTRTRAWWCWAFPATSSASRNRATKGDFRILRAELRRQLPLFKKIDVNGADAHPLFVQLKNGAGPAGVQGHQVEFHQVPDRHGRPGGQALCPTTKPQDLSREIEALLK